MEEGKSNITKPILKWVGGKTQILDEVLSLFPNNIKNYHEPFLGGGSVLLGLLSHIKSEKIKVTGKIFASDLNGNLINLYKNIQLYPSELISEVKTLVEDFSKIEGEVINRHPSNIEEALTSKESYYYWIRSRFNSLKEDERASLTASAMLLFMNKTCFRGVYREGPNNHIITSLFFKRMIRESVLVDIFANILSIILISTFIGFSFFIEVDANGYINTSLTFDSGFFELIALLHDIVFTVYVEDGNASFTSVTSALLIRKFIPLLGKL